MPVRNVAEARQGFLSYDQTLRCLMGVLTDFVVADPADAALVGASSYPAQDFNGLEAKGIDLVNLGALHEILTESEYDPDLVTEATLLFQRSPGGPWVLLVPHDLVRRLAALDRRDRDRVPLLWAQTEEFEGWEQETVTAILFDLADLCRRAVAEGKAVLMWVSL